MVNNTLPGDNKLSKSVVTIFTNHRGGGVSSLVKTLYMYIVVPLLASLLPVACLYIQVRDRGCTLFVDQGRRRLEYPRRPRVTSRLVDALKAMDSQPVTRAENMAITSSFGDLGVVLNERPYQ